MPPAQSADVYSKWVNHQRPGTGKEQAKTPPDTPGSQSSESCLGLYSDEPSRIIRESETRPISQEPLVAEVKGIYAGLVMVEAKCIEVDNRQAALAQINPGSLPKLNNEQW